MDRKKVLFVCTGNSARSQMAEGFLRAFSGGRVEVLSAGLEPRGLNPAAVEVMREKGIDISSHRSRAFSEDLARAMDYVITICGPGARERRSSRSSADPVTRSRNGCATSSRSCWPEMLLGALLLAAGLVAPW